GFRFGIDLDVEAALIPGRNGLAQARNALRHGIAVGVGALYSLDQLVNNMLGCGAVGVAHRHVDNVFPAPTRRHLQFARYIEDIRRQALDTWKRAHGWSLAEMQYGKTGFE